MNGENYRSSTYTAGWDSLKKMLDSFGNDEDGIECDYIGWHPHFGWRIIDQEFAFIHDHAGDKPIYVDDMWTTISSVGYNFGLTIPGFCQFNAPAYQPSSSDWAKKIYGDFPNSLFTGNDPHAMLLTELINENSEITNWYYARHAREVVKSFVTAFGEGAERACLSGTNDVPEFRNYLLGSIGWVNFIGVRSQGYPEKPSYYTYKLLVEMLGDFTTVEKFKISDDPRTRFYKFQRLSGPLSVLWSETGEPPPDFDYRNNPTGEYVTFKNLDNIDSLKLIHIITDTLNTVPQEKTITGVNGEFTIQLGYEPVLIEGDIIPITTDVSNSSPISLSSSCELEQNYPNPFNSSTFIVFKIPADNLVHISIYNVLGQEIRSLAENHFNAGSHKIQWDGMDNAGESVQSGLYLIHFTSSDYTFTKKCLLLK